MKRKEPEESQEPSVVRFPARVSGKPPRNKRSITPGAREVGSGSLSTTSNTKKSVMRTDIRFVKSLIIGRLDPPEHKDKVVAQLSGKHKIDPIFTHIAWNQLEKEKSELFKDYYTKFGRGKRTEWLPQQGPFRKTTSNQSLEHRRPLPVRAPSARPIQEKFQHMQVDSLLPQLPNTSTAHFQTNSRSLISSYHNKNPASGSVRLAQKNYGRGMMMEGNAPDRVRSLIRSEILNPASVAYDNQNVSAFRVGDIRNSFSPNPPTEQHGPVFVHNLHQGCNNPRQLPNPSTGHLQIDSTSHISSSLNANPASSSFRSPQMINCGRRMSMHATDTPPLQAFMKQKIPNHVSVAYNDRTQMSHFGADDSHTFSFCQPPQTEQRGTQQQWPNFMEQQGPASIDSLNEGDTIQLQLPIPSGNLQIDSISTVSYRRFGNDEDSECSRSHPAQMNNHGRGMAMDRNAADQTQMSHFGANARHPFSSYLPLPMEQQGPIFIEQQGQNFLEKNGENIMEQQGPGSSKFTGVKENRPSAISIDSDTESTINGKSVAPCHNLPSSDSQSKEAS